jgi:hypothetical protein
MVKIFRIILQNLSLNSVCKLTAMKEFKAVVERRLSAESQGDFHKDYLIQGC